VSVADLLEKAANIGDADSARSLMNLVMQFRKVKAQSIFLSYSIHQDSRFAIILNSSNVPMLLLLYRSATLGKQDPYCGKGTF